jgi:integrase
MPNVKRLLTHAGKTQTIDAWSRELGIPASTIRSRLDTLGMTVEEALTRAVDLRFRPSGGQPQIRVRQCPPLKEDERGRGIVRWSEGGRRRKRAFGAWGDPATVAAYRRWAAEWYAHQGHAEPEQGRVLCVAELIERCLDWAESHYRKEGRITSEVGGFRAALGTVNDLYGDTPAGEFAPRQLRAVQARWVGDGKSLKTCNDYLRKVVRCWRFGAGRSLVPASVADALSHVEPLVRGRTTAHKPKKIKAAPDKDIEAMIPHLHEDPERQRVLAAVVRLQRLTGMRPGEAVSVRAEEIDRSREPWLYTPSSKTMHLDKDRRVYLGPKARELLLPWIEQAEPGQPLFRFPRRRGGKMVAVSTNFLRDCIAQACQRANVPIIRPNQLRHAKGTEVQRAYEDDDAVAAALGNTAEVSRQVYVDNPADAVARRIAESLG